MKDRLKKIFGFIYFVYPVLLFAQSKSGIVPAGMVSLTDQILEVFTGTLVTTIMIIMLVGVAIAYGFNKDNDQLKRKLLAILIAIAIIVGARGIVEVVWNASKA